METSTFLLFWGGGVRLMGGIVLLASVPSHFSLLAAHRSDAVEVVDGPVEAPTSANPLTSISSGREGYRDRRMRVPSEARS